MRQQEPTSGNEHDSRITILKDEQIMDFLLQLLGLALLLGGLGLGYRRWVRPHAAHLDWQGRGLLLLVILTLMGGAIGSPFWFMAEPRSFSWLLPPLASRMLAAAAWAFVVVCYLALQRPTYRRIRLVLLLLFVYLAPLALAIILFHLDRFDPAAPITYAFFAIVGVMVAGSTWYLLRQPLMMADQERDRLPAPPLVRNWLLVVAAVFGLWGLALFITDDGPAPFIWLWPGDLLSSRLIGVMLLAIATGALYGRQATATARIILLTIITYALGIVLACAWNALVGRPIPISYLLIFGLTAIFSLALLAAGRDGLSPSVDNMNGEK
jgi:hypothetical protein